ncbi:amino acid ABC transporter permease [Egicoccus halophilus]|uniref:Ectoine/hydroxyectoine ABC transporter permease subunit EhuC n=1 Tax=Egicoccus halophilus TaxID=1670830 RepID=A0A8J3ABT9_9ACTN|nr:amino acid ABC transporter permease [Egicoccus halophilus]GGI03606.1 ectoine/hydroxyectoine ABC transporter permease subunit EhuC [Egicoccus halophilus]
MDDFLLTPGQYERLFAGFLMTVRILGASFALGIVLSLLVGVARLSQRPWVRGAALVFVEFARGISSIILLFVMAYAIPILFGVEQRNLLVLGSIALGINMGGYGAEIIRGAILAVPRGQTEASIALNLSETQRLRHVILPQALRVILPPMGNLTIEILKGTALVSLIGLGDLLAIANQMRQRVDTVVLFLNVLIAYFVLSQLINGLFRLAESRVDRRFESRAAGPDQADTLKAVT